MNYGEYTYEFIPSNNPDLFTGLSSLIDANIVLGDKDVNMKFISSYWSDWGNDVFDDWGIFLFI
jgi:hypothetical protein